MRPIALLAVCLLAVVGCEKPAKPVKGPVEVQVVTVQPQDIPIDFEFVGVARSSHEVEIRARVEGYLQSIDYVEGSMVQANQQLFQLDPIQFEEQLNAARGELQMNEAMLWRSQQNLDRLKPLYIQNAVSKRDLDDVTASVLADKARVFSAQANVANARINLTYTKILSPITGLTQRAAYREGTLITPNVNGLLTTVSVIDPIWVLFSVSDNQLLELRGEQKSNRLIVPPVDQYQVRLTLADGSAFPEPGQVNFTSPTFDPTTGTMTVRSTFPNPEGVVRPGQFVRATVSGAEAPNTIVVPQTAVSQSDAGAYVFVVENGTAHQRVVELGPWYKDQWIVNEGLKPGDVVIASGANRVQEGSQVTTTTAP